MGLVYLPQGCETISHFMELGSFLNKATCCSLDHSRKNEKFSLLRGFILILGPSDQQYGGHEAMHYTLSTLGKGN